jgi:hypothetical protein
MLTGALCKTKRGLGGTSGAGSVAMTNYPDDFDSWPLDKKNNWFAAEAAAYRVTKPKANSGAGFATLPKSATPGTFDGFEGDQRKGFSENTWREASRALALRTFAATSQRFARKKDHGRAEAALLALYGAWGKP